MSKEPVLLLKLNGIRSLNRTFFAPFLYVYEDLLLFRKRKLIGAKEITVSYNHIVQVNLDKGILLATIEIINTGAENITVKHVRKGKASEAKRIIDQKIYHVHPKGKFHDQENNEGFQSFEKSLNRLKELMNKGKISKREYNKKRKHFLDKLT